MKNKAFTLIEILIVVSVIAVIGAGAIVGATGVRESARQTKLNNDVEALNRAIPIYLTFGGSFSGDEDAEGILRKLKTKRTEDNAATSPGLTSSLIDRRLEIVWQSEDEGSKGGSRAIWNGTRFEVVESGGPGIKEFALNNQMGGSDAEREVREDFLLAHDRRKGPGWVWDYADAQPGTPEPVQPPLPGVPDPTPTLAPEPTPPEPTDAPVPTQPPTPTEEPTTPPTVEPTTPPTEPPTPSPTPVVPSVPTIPNGALIGNLGGVNSVFNGNILLAYNPNAQNIDFNSGGRVNGNLYLPGTPTIKSNANAGGKNWTPAIDGQFADVILAQGPPDGNPYRVVDLGGNYDPSNYTVTLNRNGAVTGKIYRQTERYTLTPLNTGTFGNKDSNVSAPTINNGSGTYNYNSGNAANLTINGGNPTVNLTGGHYGNYNVNAGTLVLGDPNNPNNEQVYYFDSLTLNNGNGIQIVGKVTINLKNGFNLNSNLTIGNPAHPEYLQINLWSGDFNANKGSVYGAIYAPGSRVTFNSGTTLNGGVTANTLQLNSNSVIFSTAPPTGP